MSVEPFLAEASAPATSEQITNTLLGLAGLGGILLTFLGSAVAIKKLLEGRKPEEQYVTQKQLEGCATKADLDKLENYTRESFHRMGDALQPLVVDMASVRTLQQTQSRQIDNLVDKGNTNHELLVELRTLMRDKKDVGNGPREISHGRSGKAD